jgi:hypothetical protein
MCRGYVVLIVVERNQARSAGMRGSGAGLRRLWGEALQASGPGLRTRACPLPFPAQGAAIENMRKGEDLAVPASLSQPRASIWAAAACALTLRDGAIGAS